MLNWLVIGIGDITRKRVIPAIQSEPRSSLYGVVTRDPAKAQAYPGTFAWTSLGDALKDPAINAVYVASPVRFHAEHTIAALQACKHVLCEKPVGMNYAEAKSMAEAARASGRLFGVAFYRRLYPKLVRAKELIEQGEIGQPVLAWACMQGWLESEARGWLRDPVLAGAGPIFDTASHRIDAFNFLFGKPAEATALLSNVVHKFGVEDSATVMIDYESGPRGIVDARWNSRIVRDEFRVIGTEGELNLTPLNGPELRYRDRLEMLPTHANVHYPIVENFVCAALDGAALTCPGEEAIVTDWVTERARRSSS
jgi:predicted dehydrogenase